jgi:hypothetical protein
MSKGPKHPGRRAKQHGVYRAARAADVLRAAKGLRTARIDLAAVKHKAGLLQAVARALEFPAWFGGNWDALEDCLTDLSWHKADGHMLLIEGADALPQDDLGVFRNVLESAAAYWKERGHPFFAVFVGGEATLPEFRAASAR